MTVSTELVSNAYEHAAGPRGIYVELMPGGNILRITVVDGSRTTCRAWAPRAWLTRVVAA